MSGSTGTDNVHLDLTVFWVPKQNSSNVPPIPRSYGFSGHQDFNSFISLAQTQLYGAVIIDPLEIWADLNQGVNCLSSISCQ